jgi:predicted dehydrogenase
MRQTRIKQVLLVPLSQPSLSTLAAGVEEMTIGIGILGAGRWGAHLIRKFLAEPRVRVVAIADPYAPSLDRVREQHGLGAETTLTTDWRSLLGLPGLDAIVVATPAASHYEMIEASLQQGYHVMAEKPLTLTTSDSEALCRLAQTQGRLMVVDHTYLFNPAVEAAKAAIAAGQLGQIRYGYASRTHLCPVRQDVDALWDLAIHDIAIFNYWLGESPVSAQAQGHVWLQPQHETALSPQGLADTVWAGLHYGSGIPVQLHLSWLNPDKQRRLVLVGDRAALIFDELAPEPLVLMTGSLEMQPQGYVPAHLARQAIAIPEGEPLQRVCAHFVDCIEQQKPSDRSSGEVGTQLVKVLTALSRSMTVGGPISIEACDQACP